MNNTLNEKTNLSSFKGGLLLLRASWSTLKLDKEMILLPLIAGVLTTISIAFMAFLAWKSGAIEYRGFTFSRNFKDLSPFTLLSRNLALFFLYLNSVIAVIILNFCSAALVAAALHRFRGNDPTISYALQQAKKHWQSVLSFSLLSVSIGILLRLLGERVSSVNKFITNLIGMTWSFATVFAIPVIVASEHHLGPLQAVRASAATIKKTWKETITGGLSLQVIFTAAYFPLIALFLLSTSFAVIYGVKTLIISLPVFVTIVALGSSLAKALNSIFHAALFHFATTGESPTKFDKSLLQAAFRPKKDWFV